MSDESDSTGRTMAFECPDCGTENPLVGDPEDFKGRVFSCEGCGESVLLKNHRTEPPEKSSTEALE